MIVYIILTYGSVFKLGDFSYHIIKFCDQKPNKVYIMKSNSLPKNQTTNSG